MLCGGVVAENYIVICYLVVWQLKVTSLHAMRWCGSRKLHRYMLCGVVAAKSYIIICYLVVWQLNVTSLYAMRWCGS